VPEVNVDPWGVFLRAPYYNVRVVRADPSVLRVGFRKSVEFDGKADRLFVSAGLSAVASPFSP
jgi:hypothetical protein